MFPIVCEVKCPESEAIIPCTKTIKKWTDLWSPHLYAHASDLPSPMRKIRKTCHLSVSIALLFSLISVPSCIITMDAYIDCGHQSHRLILIFNPCDYVMPPKVVVVGATGWYGKTFVYEYILRYGIKSQENLKLYASSRSILSYPDDSLWEKECLMSSSVEAVEDNLDIYQGLIWYSFLLRSKVSLVGLERYRIENDGIASIVFKCLSKNSHLRTIFFSSGSAYDYNECPAYDADPYSHLKIVYQRELADLVSLITIYPYATLGKFVSSFTDFAAASFIFQAISSGEIVIKSSQPVIRSYGCVHDFSRLILCLLEQENWSSEMFLKVLFP